MRMPADHDGVKYSGRKDILDVLRQQRETGCHFLSRQLSHRLAAQGCHATIRSFQPGKCMQGQGFADAIRAQHRQDIAGMNLEVEIFDQCPARYGD
jgi:hypothetical protein